jgi:hypothetical protein
VPAPASVPEFLVKLIGQKYGLDLQAAPYRGSAPMIADMLGNQIGAGVGSIPDFIENHKAGKLRVVAVMGNARQAAVPEAPTFAELGLAGFEDVPYYGLFAPAGTPQAAIDRIGEALSKTVAMPDVRDKLTAMGLAVGYMPQQQLATPRTRLHAGLGEDHQGERLPAAVTHRAGNSSQRSVARPAVPGQHVSRPRAARPAWSGARRSRPPGCGPGLPAFPTR